MTQESSLFIELAEKVAGQFAQLAQVEAIALGGSQTGEYQDSASDIDLYVYTRDEIPLAVRRQIVEKSGGASKASLGLTFWGPGDEWFEAASGIEVDVVYFDAEWMEGQVKQVVELHRASLGYSTCFWHTIRQSRILYDPHHWFQRLQDRCRQEYPEALRRNIIDLNHPVLRGLIPSYYNQIAKAIKRQDLVSVNHRIAALFASYFDLLFSFNRVLHPGEKRLVSFAWTNCQKLPDEMASDIEAVLCASSSGDPALLTHLDRMLDRLDDLLDQD